MLRQAWRIMQGSEHQKWAANLQPTLNKGREETSLTIFVTECLQNENFFEKGFLNKSQKNFEKSGLPLRGDYIGMFFS